MAMWEADFSEAENRTFADSAEAVVLRERMVRLQLAGRGIHDPRVLAAMEEVPRHWFCAAATALEDAYGDYPLPIGWGQTISQPWIVADMLQCLQLTGVERVLEIGTGSGYNAALLSRLAGWVLSLEVIPALAERARAILQDRGFSVQVLVADGSLGWPAEGPYDAIVVTAGAPAVPEALKAQLGIGGRLVIPVGDRSVQQLLVLRRTVAGFVQEERGACRFVPLTGVQGWGGDREWNE